MNLDNTRFGVALEEVRILDPQFASFVRLTLYSRGPRGLCITLKALKSWALQILSGNGDYRAAWFKWKRYGGIPIPLKAYTLFKKIILAAQHKEYGTLKRLLSVLNIYTVVDGPIDQDIPSSVSTASSPEPTINSQKRFFWEKLVQLSVAALNLPYYSGHVGSPKPTGQTVAIEPRVNGTWKDYILQGSVSAGSYVQFRRNLGPYWAGNLGVVGDVGGKTRLIAIATPEAQGMLEPLKVWLLRVLSCLPWDCTFRQGDGLQIVSRWTLEGRKIFSVDLKDATWHFPAALQKIVCYSLNINLKLIDTLFSAAFTSRWTEEWVQPKKGQAMGLGPSFPLFALTHGIIIYGICRYLGVDPSDNFLVLGDDVVIRNELVYNMYIEFLHTWDVPISLNKTFISRHCAEFAGGFVWYGRDIRPIKWRKLLPFTAHQLVVGYRKILNNWTRLLAGGKHDIEALWGLSPSLGGLGLKQTRLSSGGLAKRYAYLKALEESLQAQTPINFGTVSYSDVVWQPLWESPLLEDEGLGPDDDSLRALQAKLETTVVHSWVMNMGPTPVGFANQLGMDLGPLLPVRPKQPGFDRIPYLSVPKGYCWKSHQLAVLNLLLERRKLTDEENSSKEKAEIQTRTEVVGIWNQSTFRLERVGTDPNSPSSFKEIR